MANTQIIFDRDLRTHVGRKPGACLASANGESRQYALHLKGFVGGADFDRNYVDYVLNQHMGKPVNVLIDSLGSSVATALSIASAFRHSGTSLFSMSSFSAELRKRQADNVTTGQTLVSMQNLLISLEKNAIFFAGINNKL